MSVFSKVTSNVEDLHGIWRIMPSSAITEIIAQSGFDFQILDCEHGMYDYSTLYQDILACEANGCSPFVRVSGLNNVEVQRCLDMGAHGIVFPQLSSLDDFKKAIALLSYAPEGIRGFNPFVRANKYGINNKKEVIEPLCIAIIETLSAVAELDNILLLKGIDILYIGSYDLSAQLGVIGQMDAPELVQVIDSIIDKCVQVNKPVALMAHNKDQYNYISKKGIKCFVHSVDSFKIKNVFSDYLNKF